MDENKLLKFITKHYPNGKIENKICKRKIGHVEIIDYIVYTVHVQKGKSHIIYWQNPKIISSLTGKKRKPMEKNMYIHAENIIIEPQLDGTHKIYKDVNGEMHIFYYVEPKLEFRPVYSGSIIDKSFSATQIIHLSERSISNYCRGIFKIISDKNNTRREGIYWSRSSSNHTTEFEISPIYLSIETKILKNKGKYIAIFICQKENGKYTIKIENNDSSAEKPKWENLKDEYDSIKCIGEYVILISGQEIEPRNSEGKVIIIKNIDKEKNIITIEDNGAEFQIDIPNEVLRKKINPIARENCSHPPLHTRKIPH